MEEEEAPVKKEKTHFIVKLTELKAADKVKLIKEVKNCMQGLNLVQVRSCVMCHVFFNGLCWTCLLLVWFKCLLLHLLMC